MATTKRKPVEHSIGSFSETDAAAIVEALDRTAGIRAESKRLMVGPREDEPTEWWRVFVPITMARSAEAWLVGWRAGRVHAHIETRRSNHGGTYQEAAHWLGYLEIMPKSE